MAGMRLSSTTTDGRCSAMRANPSGPSNASTTSKPARVSARTKKRRTASSSSIRRTRPATSIPGSGIEHLADAVGQVGGPERLGEEVHARIEEAVVHDGGLGVSGDVQHAEPGPAGAKPVGDLDAPKLRGRDVPAR